MIEIKVMGLAIKELRSDLCHDTHFSYTYNLQQITNIIKKNVLYQYDTPYKISYKSLSVLKLLVKKIFKANFKMEYLRNEIHFDIRVIH